MKNLLAITSIIIVIAMTTLFGYKSVALAANQSVETISQSKDLCGSTGGNGKIISVENNSFTLLRNDGRNLIVNLTSRATIETSTGFVSLFDLKTGDRVTLVGDDNRDGSFTADAVVVCGGTDQTTLLVVRNSDANYKKVSGVINVATILLIGLIWLGIIIFLKLNKQKSFVYLIFFTIFYIYLYKVLDYTLIQFQSLLLLQHFLPGLMLNGFKAGTNVNLIPLATLTLEDVKTSFLNILMMLPFGFGLPFIANFRLKKVVIAGLLLSIGIELLQLLTGFMANTTFRIADINDLIFNTLGVTIGYILFTQFVLAFCRVSRNRKMRANPILQYIAERPQINAK